MNQNFFDIFNNWFGESADIYDISDVKKRAETVAVVLIEDGVVSKELAINLQQFIQRWSPEELAEFSQKSDVDWAFGPEEEASLKVALDQISSTLKAKMVPDTP